MNAQQEETVVVKRAKRLSNVLTAIQPLYNGVPLKALVVDDNQDALALKRRELEGEGFEVVCTGSGEEAVCILKDRGKQFLVMFVDLDLRGAIDGLTVLESAREFAGIKILWSGCFPSSEVKKRLVGLADYFSLKGSDEYEQVAQGV